MANKPFDIPNNGDDIAFAPEDETLVSKCASCGGNLVFNPSTFSLRCEHCGNIVEIRHRMASEIDFAKLVDAQSAWNGETRVFECNSCGARQVISRKNMSPVCAFCGTANVVALDSIVGLKPNAVLPFTIDGKNAQEVYARWARSKFFSPRKFKKQVRAEKLVGHYFPAFTFDSDTVTTYVGELGEYYYTTYTDSEGHVHTQQHTRWFPISGTFNRSFNDIFVQATAPNTQVTLKKISPFDTDYAQEYTDNYLYGFSASQNERSGLECWNEARGVMEKNVRRGILGTYSYDVVGYLRTNMQCFDITFKYVLLPVYIGHSTYRKKLYNFYMNGQNGRIVGKSPKSVAKILSLIFGGLAVVGGIVAALLLI